MNNHLTQAQVAAALGVCEDTVVEWEMRGIAPSMRQMPAIINLLGYLPISIDTETVGGRITSFRYLHGLTPYEFGTLIPADASTILAWERGKHTPRSQTLAKLEQVFNG